MVFHDVQTLAQELMAYVSITPNSAGCLEDLESHLSKMGWGACLKKFNDTTNLYASIGQGSPHLCFAGHIDVVPAGDEKAWMFAPFTPTIHDNKLYGRGAADMKGAVAAFLSAASILSSNLKGTCSLLLTSDEEGCALDGLQRMIPWLKKENFSPNLILIGEPTGQKVGQTLQIGRRGSVTGKLTLYGTQGHIAYPHLADNPLKRALSCGKALLDMPLDQTVHQAFQPSHLEITSIDTGNAVTNIIPSTCHISFGVRYNPLQNAVGLCEKIRDLCAQFAGHHELVFQCHGDPFLTQDHQAIALVQKSICEITGNMPEHTTQGGTTDGRFLCSIAPVLELGLPETTIHQVNEHISLEDLHTLKSIYGQILKNFFTL